VALLILIGVIVLVAANSDIREGLLLSQLSQLSPLFLATLWFLVSALGMFLRRPWGRLLAGLNALAFTAMMVVGLCNPPRNPPLVFYVLLLAFLAFALFSGFVLLRSRPFFGRDRLRHADLQRETQRRTAARKHAPTTTP
jgi:thiol:disulfide interchange protein